MRLQRRTIPTIKRPFPQRVRYNTTRRTLGPAAPRREEILQRSEGGACNRVPML